MHQIRLVVYRWPYHWNSILKFCCWLPVVVKLPCQNSNIYCNIPRSLFPIGLNRVYKVFGCTSFWSFKEACQSVSSSRFKRILNISGYSRFFFLILIKVKWLSCIFIFSLPWKQVLSKVCLRPGGGHTILRQLFFCHGGRTRGLPLSNQKLAHFVDKMDV